MATIMLRDIPDEFMEELKQAAALERRSVPAEVLHLTEIGVRQTLLLHRDNAQTIARLRQRLLDTPPFLVSAAELIDEDRQR